VPKNLIQHIEWTTRDPERLKNFFRQIFDWNFLDAMPGYTLIEGVGGVFQAPDTQMPIVVTPYVNVSDLRSIEERAAAAGGRIHKSKQEVPGRGWYSILSDPDGNLLGLWQAMAPPASAGRTSRARGAKKTTKRAASKTAKKTARKVAGKPAKKTARKAAPKKAARKRARR